MPCPASGDPAYRRLAPRFAYARALVAVAVLAIAFGGICVAVAAAKKPKQRSDKAAGTAQFKKVLDQVASSLSVALPRTRDMRRGRKRN
jgi:hypothetical protein